MAHLVGGRVSEGSDFYTLDISFFFFTLFESAACVSKAHFVFLVACFFLLLFEKAVFEKVENLVTHTVIDIRQLSFLTHLQQFLPPFLCGFA